jgi:C1A family cysteine protease
MKYGLGWHRDLPDVRDYHKETDTVKEILDKSAPLTSLAAGQSPLAVDLREWCSPVEDQGQLGSCTAHAGVGLMEYYQRRVYGKHVDLARLFLYKTTRKLMGWMGDTGAYLRTTMQAMVMFGVPLEKHYAYIPDAFDFEPSAFDYAMAQNYKSMKYFRIDSNGISGDLLLDQIKWMLAAGLPAMFGFTVYSSLSGAAYIPYPSSKDTVEGGHAVLAVGYDDDEGTLLIRNSWGTEWGNKGYGYLPYEYVTAGLASDFWTMAEAGFVDSELFAE